MLPNFGAKKKSHLSGRKTKNTAINKFIMVCLFFVSFISHSVIFISESYSQVPEDSLILDELIKIGLEENPQLQSLASAVQADSAKIPQTGTLTDPVLSLNILNLPTNSLSFDQEPMTGKQIALKQSFPFPGKLSLNEKISSEQAAVSIATYQEFRNQLIRDLKMAYYELFFLDKAIEITDKNRALVREFSKIAETKYMVGKGIQQDVLKAQVEYSRMSDKIIQLEQKRDVARAQINTLVNAPVQTVLGKTVEPDYSPLVLDLDSLKKIALINRPLFEGWESLRKQSQFQIDLARKEYWPDLSIFVAYTQREPLQNGMPGYDFLSGGISLNIPIFAGQKQSKKVEENVYSKNMVEARFTQVLNQVYFELEKIRSSVDKNARLVSLYKSEIIPQASQSVASALAGYQTDKIDFLTLINNLITLFNYDIEYYRVLNDYNKDLASLEFQCGRQLISE